MCLYLKGCISAVLEGCNTFLLLLLHAGMNRWSTLDRSGVSDK